MTRAIAPLDNEFLAKKVAELTRRVEILETWVRQNEGRLGPDYADDPSQIAVGD